MTCRKCGKDIPEGSSYCMYCGSPQEPPKRSKRTNGTGTVYKAKGRTTWTAVRTLYYYLDREGNQHRKTVKKSGFKTKREAIDYLNTVSAGSDGSSVRLFELWRTYSNGEMQKLSKTTQQGYEIAWSRLSPLAERPIEDITIDELRSIVAGLTRDPAKDIRSVMSHLYKLAMAQKKCTVNLAQFIMLPEAKDEVPAPFTPEEVARLWAAYNDGVTFCGYMLIMIYTGLMPGEIREVTRSTVDFKECTITGAGLKTSTRRKAAVVFPDQIGQVLRELFAESGSMMLYNGSKGHFYTMYTNALAAAGIPYKPPYACRHTFGTQLDALGTSAALTKELMRHASLTSTMRYIHKDLDTDRNEVNRLLNG